MISVKLVSANHLDGLVDDDVWRRVIDAIPGDSLYISKNDIVPVSRNFMDAVGADCADEIKKLFNGTFLIPRNINNSRSGLCKDLLRILGQEKLSEILNEFGGRQIRISDASVGDKNKTRLQIFKDIVGGDAFDKIRRKFGGAHLPLTRGWRYILAEKVASFDLDAEQQRWPLSLQDIARTIGKDASYALVKGFGGKEIYIPKNITGGDLLSPVIGIPAAVLLSNERGATFYQVPTLHNSGKKALILDLHQQGGLSFAKIAAQAGVTCRYVSKVLNG